MYSLNFEAATGTTSEAEEKNWEDEGEEGEEEKGEFEEEEELSLFSPAADSPFPRSFNNSESGAGEAELCRQSWSAGSKDILL